MITENRIILIGPFKEKLIIRFKDLDADTIYVYSSYKEATDIQNRTVDKKSNQIVLPIVQNTGEKTCLSILFLHIDCVNLPAESTSDFRHL